eukprot:4053106-Alexandrium_andersonii.AAC.1
MTLPPASCGAGGWSMQQRRCPPTPPWRSTSVTGSPRTPRCWQRDEGRSEWVPEGGTPNPRCGARGRGGSCARGKAPTSSSNRESEPRMLVPPKDSWRGDTVEVVPSRAAAGSRALQDMHASMVRSPLSPEWHSRL